MTFFDWIVMSLLACSRGSSSPIYSIHTSAVVSRKRVRSTSKDGKHKPANPTVAIQDVSLTRDDKRVCTEARARSAEGAK
jgi:hypothetical protein